MRVTGNDGLLLTYLNASNSNYDVTELLNAKTKAGKTEPVSEEEKKKFSEIKTDAVKVQSDISKLLVTGEDSLFTTAEKTGSKVDILSALGNFVEDYNRMAKELATTSDESNKKYLKELTDLFQNSKDSLGEIGLTLNTDGTIAADTKKLEAASVEQLKKVCQESGYLQKVSEKSEYIAANAEVDVYLANASNYTASGAYANQGNTSAMMAELYHSLGSCFDSQS